MEPGAGPRHLPGGECQRDQAAGIVGAVHVLGDAHAPEDDRRLGAGVHARHLLDRLGRNAAHRLHRLGREAVDLLGKLGEAFGEARDVLLVREVFLDDGVQHGVQERHVAARLETQVDGGVT